MKKETMMKKLTFTLILVISTICAKAQIINFPNANFKAKLLEANYNNNIASSAQPFYDSTSNSWSTNSSNSIDTNNDGEIQIQEAEIITILNLSGSNITSLEGLNYFTNLISLRSSFTGITNLDLSQNVNLKSLDCSNNQLANLDLSSNPLLTSLHCHYNQISNLNITQNNQLEILFCCDNQITNLNISQNTALKTLICSSNQLSILNTTSNINLEILECHSNNISNLNLSQNILLTRLTCAYNPITNLDLSQNINLIYLNCDDIEISNINITQNISLKGLDVSNNQLTGLDISNNNLLESIDCQNNQLTNLDVSNNNLLEIIDCRNNQLTNLDVSNNFNLTILNCKDNLLTMLNIKNNSIEKSYNSPMDMNYTSISLIGNPTLQYICADETQINLIQNKIQALGYINCHVNTYCSFVPGGEFYTIEGQQKFDNENDGCDITDSTFPNLKYSITDGITTGSIISNNSGNYAIPVQAGQYTITPILENPNYFTATPPNVVMSFPTQTSPFTQDFCIRPNGIKHDVEVSIIPTTVARPGFDAIYKIIYKNKGNQVENGTINLQFDDAVLDIVSTNPAFTTQTLNNLSFNYSNLNPFETREISVVLNVNSPVESPAVNAGDFLIYIAEITQLDSDELPIDNTFGLKQLVVNSLDPNDKTCLQGTTISPSEVGKYVHYMIRFENTGTFPAENIVVKDMIDTTKFDVSSLVPLNASHNYVTKISGNKVEFIFENINLPFDDANNDGYIAFKIKTLPSLVIGNTFSNSANIYFDYNFPIVTNTATTTIAALNNPSFEFANYFSLYPNPTSNELYIALKSAIEINSIEIYNPIGQLVTVQTGNALKVDVSNLKTGNYFIKINTNEGFSTSQFIKE